MLPLVLAVSVDAQPMARAGSTDIFTLRGATAAPIGAPTWPVMAGDEITAGLAPVTVSFADGSRVVLKPGATARMRMEGRSPVLELMHAVASFALKPGTAVRVFAGGQPLPDGRLLGSVSIPDGANAGLKVSMSGKGDDDDQGEDEDCHKPKPVSKRKKPCKEDRD